LLLLLAAVLNISYIHLAKALTAKVYKPAFIIS